MKLKTRLIISFFIIICVPIALTCVALWGFGNYQLRSIEENFGVDDLSYESLSNSLQMLTKSTQKTFEEMQAQAEENPDRFREMAYLESLNKELSRRDSYLIMRMGEDMLYYAGTKEDISELFQELPVYGDYGEASDSGIYIGRDVQSFVKQLDMVFSDHTTGSAFVITGVGYTAPQVRLLMRDMVIAILVILVLTSALLTSWIYKGISSPLNKLRKATKHIKDGDMDYSLEVQGEDEISQLCRDFEQMRMQLKISAEQKAEYAKDNRELIRNISHDLKTPITTVKGYVEGIMDGVADTPEKMDRYIRTIYNKANEMDRLVNELTFYSKIDTNRIPYTFTKINVNSYFEDCVEEVGVELESRNIRLSYNCTVAGDTLIIADPEQLKRVINNIIGNSVKYMDKPQGSIAIRVEDAGDFIQVEIEDNGKGIAAKDLPSIFDRFFRTDASRNSSQGGSGIGLSIVKKIIEDHGGKIWASSKLGEGTTMCFVLRKYQEVPMNE